MAQSRQSYAYNPDVATRKWHQKWINPIISLQNAPPTSHGTPAPTKEDGEVGHAGFKVYSWVPMDEDEDVTEEMLQQEIDWWSKPGAPKRPELRAQTSSATPVVPTEKKGDEDVMQIDPPEETAKTDGAMDGISTDVGPPPAAPTVAPTESSPFAVTSTPVAPKPQSPAQQADTEMTDGHLSPVHLSAVPGSSPSPSKHSPATLQHKPPSPLPPPQPTESISTPKSPLKSLVSPEPTTMEDILGESKSSTPSDPLAQAEEVAAGLAIEAPTEHSQHVMDAVNLSGVGGGIAGDGIVGGGNEDLGDTEQVASVEAQRTNEEEQMLSETKDLDTEIVKDDMQE
jgi:hypothetical protein